MISWAYKSLLLASIGEHRVPERPPSPRPRPPDLRWAKGACVNVVKPWGSTYSNHADMHRLSILLTNLTRNPILSSPSRKSPLHAEQARPSTRGCIRGVMPVAAKRSLHQSRSPPIERLNVTRPLTPDTSVFGIHIHIDQEILEWRLWCRGLFELATGRGKHSVLSVIATLSLESVHPMLRLREDQSWCCAPAG